MYIFIELPSHTQMHTFGQMKNLQNTSESNNDQTQTVSMFKLMRSGKKASKKLLIYTFYLIAIPMYPYPPISAYFCRHIFRHIHSILLSYVINVQNDLKFIASKNETVNNYWKPPIYNANDNQNQTLLMEVILIFYTLFLVTSYAEIKTTIKASLSRKWT